MISHRGFSHSAPENTLSSVIQSIEVGADYCEFDVRMTSDGQVVLMHDRFVDRTTDGTGVVDKMTLDELLELDAGSWKGEAFTGEKIATLDVVLQKLKLTQQVPVIEIKDNLAAPMVVDCVMGNSMADRVVLLSPDEKTLKLIRTIDRRIRRAFLCQSFPRGLVSVPNRTEWLCEIAGHVGVDIINIDYRYLSKDMIAGLQKHGLEVWSWTVNVPEIMKCLAGWGIDAITSDRPDLLIEVSKSNY